VYKNGKIHKEAAIPYVVEVVLNILVDVECPISTQLPKSRDSWNYLQPLTLPEIISLHNERHLRPRPNERHITL
jgi:hypothetical protein